MNCAAWEHEKCRYVWLHQWRNALRPTLLRPFLGDGILDFGHALRFRDGCKTNLINITLIYKFWPFVLGDHNFADTPPSAVDSRGLYFQVPLNYRNMQHILL